MIACLSEPASCYSFAEVNSMTAHRIECPAMSVNEAVSAARLIRDALVLKLAEIDLQIEACRCRIEVIEGRFGLTQRELDEALARRSLDISTSEAEAWNAELELFESLNGDRRRLQTILG